MNKTKPKIALTTKDIERYFARITKSTEESQAFIRRIEKKMGYSISPKTLSSGCNPK